MDIQFEPLEDSLLYEVVVEEIALEGLDGITLQGLTERCSYRANSPLSKGEAPQVFESLWFNLQQDLRLRFYLLPTRRPNLLIWDRNEHHDLKGTVIELDDAPEEIYTYKCIEIRDFEATEARVRAKARLKGSRNKRLSQSQIDRIDIGGGGGQGQVVLEGIRFASSVEEISSASSTSKLKGKPKTEKKRSAAGPRSKTKDNARRIKFRKMGDGDNGDGGTGTSNLVAIRGSCSQNDGRVDITSTLRGMYVSYAKAMATMGNRLVIVASQFFRESLLLQSANQVEMSGVQYCMVERVGRARYHGEQARGKVSLTAMGVDAKALFYHRKLLLAEGIISKQPLVMRFKDSKTATLISVFHLPYFFRRQDNPEAVKVRKIFAYVCNAPNNYVDYFKLQNIFGKYFMRTLGEEYKDFVKIEEVPFGVMYPEDLEYETNATKKENMSKRKIRVVTLRNSNQSLRELIQRQLCKQESLDNEDPEGEMPQNQGDEEEDATFDWTHCYVPERELAHESELSQLLRLLIRKGRAGIRQQELTEEMALTSLDARSALRYLTRWKVANSHMEDTGKTKASCLTFFKCGIVKQEKNAKEESDEESNPVANFSDISKIEINAPQEEDGERILPNDSCSPVIPSALVVDTFVTPPTPNEVIQEGTAVMVQPKKMRAHAWKSKISAQHKQLKLPLPPPVPSPNATVDNPNLFMDVYCPQSLPPSDPLDINNVAEVKQKNHNRVGIGGKRLATDDDPRILAPKRRRVRHLADPVDLQASISRERRRADWSSEEDRILLYLFIGSVVFIPRYNLDKVFIYNAPQIRDIMHRLLPAESKTKTTAAIRRRIHGMLKTRTLFSKYRTLLEKALRDEELYTKLIEPHLPPPSISIYHEVTDTALEAVLEFLSNKFHPKKLPESLMSTRMHIPEDKPTTDLETLLDARELRRVETIWTDVWANMFYGFYRQKLKLTPIVPLQPEAIAELQSEGLVIEEQGPSWVLPYGPPEVTVSVEPEIPCIYSDEQLEYVFDVATTLVSTTDKVMTEEPPSSSSSDDEGVQNVVSKDKRGCSGGVSITLKMKGQGGYVPELCTGERNAASSIEIFNWTCRSVFMSVLFGGGGTTESLRAFMAIIPEATLSRLANSLRARGVFTVVKTVRRLILTNYMKRKLANFLHPNAFRLANSLFSSLQLNNRAYCSRMSTQNTGSAYILAEIGPLVRINSSMPNSIIVVKDEWREEYEAILSSQQFDTVHGREETALRLLRLRLNAEPTTKSRLVEKDFFDINLPQIELNTKDQVPVTLHTFIFGEGEFYTQKSKLENKLFQNVQFDEETGIVGITNPVLGAFEGLYCLIDITGNIGISIPFLLKHFNQTELRAGLDYLIENKFVYMVGIRNIKYVTSRHMSKWTLTMTGPDGTSPPQRVVIRPWINAFGGINWKLIDRIIVGLLGQLHRHSQVFIQRLILSLSPLLSCVEVLIVICAMKELKIVDVFKFRDVKPGRRFNFFSNWNEIENDGEDDDLEAPIKDYSIDIMFDLEQAWVELMPFNVAKYAKIQSLIIPDDTFISQNDDYNGFDPEDVEIMIGHEVQDDEDDEERLP